LTADTEIVITGAGSYVGQLLVRDLCQQEYGQVAGFVSTRTCVEELVQDPMVTYYSADLTRALTGEMARAASGACRLFHLAWARGANEEEVRMENSHILDTLEASLPDLSRIVFFSSVAAGPHVLSVYGRVKHEIECRVRDGGGLSLVVGGVLEKESPGSSMARFWHAVQSAHLRIRFIRPTPLFHLISPRDLLAICSDAIENPDRSGVYAAYAGGGMCLNDVLKWIEASRPGVRFPLPASSKLALLLARLLRVVGVGAPAEVLCTLFSKDYARLSALNHYPGVELKDTELEIIREVEGAH
jgi:nucleoside-diphosphate-sugar epimerase